MATGYNAGGRLTRYAFACGSVERVGEYVSITMEHGAYIIRRHPSHGAGWLVRSCRTVKEARRLAAAMNRGETPERRDY
jgi:hypothetical protein